MAVNLKQNATGDMGLQGRDLDDGPFIPVIFHWHPGSGDTTISVPSRRMRVKSINARVDTPGTDAGVVNAVVRKVTSGTAIGSGTALHSGTINLKGTANTNQTMTLVAGTEEVAAGECIGVDLTGNMIAALGSVTVWLNPV